MAKNPKKSGNISASKIALVTAVIMLLREVVELIELLINILSK